MIIAQAMIGFGDHVVMLKLKKEVERGWSHCENFRATANDTDYCLFMPDGCNWRCDQMGASGGGKGEGYRV